MTFANNSQYKEVFHSKVHDVRFYIPEGQYHLSRYIEAGAQAMYSAAGTTKDYLDKITKVMLDKCNKEKSTEQLRTDMAILINNIRVRLSYPIDEDAALRTGAIYTFIEGEEPDRVDAYWLRKKMDMCKGEKPDMELYSFFLNMGVELTPEWKQSLNPLETIEEYLTIRQRKLHEMTPH